MGVRKRMHGRRRHPSRCTAPFKHVDVSKPADHKHGKETKVQTEAVADPKEADRQQYLESQPSVKQAPGKPYQEPKDVSTVQKFQSALTPVEFVEGPVGAVAGAINMLVSGGRGTYHAIRGEGAESASNFTDASLSLTGIVPGFGIAATTAKQAKYLRAASKYGQARHMDDAVEIVTGAKVGDVLSPEKGIIKKLTK
jgi:hypothetical protein